MITQAIDNSKHHLLREELKSEYPSLRDKELNSESLESIIASLSLITHQDESTIEKIIEKKLEYISSKSI